jgi:hypothetical protein
MTEIRRQPHVTDEFVDLLAGALEELNRIESQVAPLQPEPQPKPEDQPRITLGRHRRIRLVPDTLDISSRAGRITPTRRASQPGASGTYDETTVGMGENKSAPLETDPRTQGPETQKEDGVESLGGDLFTVVAPGDEATVIIPALRLVTSVEGELAKVENAATEIMHPVPAPTTSQSVID